MSGERRTVQGEIPDSVADRDEGYTHNPNPQDELEIQRARFAEQQRQLQQDRREAAEAITEVSERLEQDYQAAQHDPDHEAFIPTQREEQATMGSATHGGHGYTHEQSEPTVVGLGVDVPRRFPPPRRDDELEDDERQTR